MYDPGIARWLSPDPKDQYFSAYLAMGNNPISMIDPDGGADGLSHKGINYFGDCVDIGDGSHDNTNPYGNGGNSGGNYGGGGSSGGDGGGGDSGGGDGGGNSGGGSRGGSGGGGDNGESSSSISMTTPFDADALKALGKNNTPQPVKINASAVANTINQTNHTGSTTKEFNSSNDNYHFKGSNHTGTAHFPDGSKLHISGFGNADIILISSGGGVPKVIRVSGKDGFGNPYPDEIDFKARDLGYNIVNNTITIQVYNNAGASKLLLTLSGGSNRPSTGLDWVHDFSFTYNEPENVFDSPYFNDDWVENPIQLGMDDFSHSLH
jgi:hypothetical protein